MGSTLNCLFQLSLPSNPLWTLVTQQPLCAVSWVMHIGPFSPLVKPLFYHCSRPFSSVLVQVALHSSLEVFFFLMASPAYLLFFGYSRLRLHNPHTDLNCLKNTKVLASLHASALPPCYLELGEIIFKKVTLVFFSYHLYDCSV